MHETWLVLVELVTTHALLQIVIEVLEPAKPEPDNVISKPPPKLPSIAETVETAKLYVNCMFLVA